MIRTAAAATLLAVALVGCSPDPEPEPLPPAPSASPTPVALSVPPEAKAATAQGAAAFTRFFFSEVNRSYELLDASPVQALSAPDCNSCKNIVEDIQRLRDAELSVKGARFKLDYAEAPPLEADGSAFVDFQFDADPYVEVDSAGKVSRDNPAKTDQVGQAKVVRQGDGWLMSGLRMVEG